MSKYRYREVKNYIHNELKLTKEDIKGNYDSNRERRSKTCLPQYLRKRH